jgi:hypothetical protein
VIAEAAKAEPLPQAGLLHLDPADHLQVAGSHAQQRAAPRQVVQRLFHARHANQVQLMAALGTVWRMASRMASIRASSTRPECRPGAGLAQNRGVGAAVQQDAGQRDFKAGYAVHAGGKRVNMHAVAAAQQRAVNVEEISVLRIPVKAWLDGDARFSMVV